MRISNQTHLQATVNDMLQFEERLHQLSLKIYPSESLRDFVNQELLPILQKLREILLLEIQHLNQGTKQDVSTNVKGVIEFWWDEHLQFLASKISSADLKSSPFELMEVFKNMISSVDSEEFEIITSPINVLNFTFQEIWQPVKMVLESNLGISRYTNKKIIDLTFPTQHKDNIFLSGIFAHEIGHYFDRNKNIWSEIFTQVVQGNNYIQDLKPFFRKNNGSPVTDIEVLSLLNQQILGSWIQEAVADCVAVHLLGPAFIFSLQELLISLIGQLYVQTRCLLDIPSPTHPRSGLRLDFQINTLKALDLYDPLPTEVQTLLDNIKNDWEAGTIYYPDDILETNTSEFLLNQSSYQIIEALWKQCLPLVQSEVANLIADNTMTIAQIEEAKLLASERVRWLVPPNEVNGQVASAQAIINSGWFAKLLYKDEIFSLINRTEMPESEYELMNLINGLLKYALHAAQIHERWQR